MIRPKGLGRGLDALLAGGDDPAPATESLQTLSIDRLRAGKYQPRSKMDAASLAELALSIKEQGVMQPILVRPVAGGHFEIVAGERRWRSAQQAGLREIPALVSPILSGEADFVQGSRYLRGGSFGNMPAYRVVGTRVIHPLIASMAARKRITESTNGFRAFRTALLRDPRIDWRQTWLDRYELEPYLLVKAIRLGYRHMEVPVTKIYPPHQIGYTKMRPVIDWWSIIRPVVYLGLGLRR